MGNRRNALEIPEYAPVAVDVRLEDLPIIDPRFARSAGVSQHEPRFNLLRKDRNCLTVNPVGVEVDCAHAAIERGIVVLASGRHLNDLRLYVLRYDAHLLERQM